MQKEKHLESLVTFSKDPQLAIFEEILAISDSLNKLKDKEYPTKLEVSNLEEAHTDFSYLEDSLVGVASKLDAVVKSIKEIPPTNLKAIEQLFVASAKTTERTNDLLNKILVELEASNEKEDSEEININVTIA